MQKTPADTYSGYMGRGSHERTLFFINVRASSPRKFPAPEDSGDGVNRRRCGRQCPFELSRPALFQYAEHERGGYQARHSRIEAPSYFLGKRQELRRDLATAVSAPPLPLFLSKRRENWGRGVRLDRCQCRSPVCCDPSRGYV